jgi:YD repeat-containing protein
MADPESTSPNIEHSTRRAAYVCDAGRKVTPLSVCAVLALVLLTVPALAQQRIVYDKAGRVVAREATDTQGTTHIYDAAGNRIGSTTSKPTQKKGR